MGWAVQCPWTVCRLVQYSLVQASLFNRKSKPKLIIACLIHKPSPNRYMFNSCLIEHRLISVTLHDSMNMLWSLTSKDMYVYNALLSERWHVIWTFCLPHSVLHLHFWKNYSMLLKHCSTMKYATPPIVDLNTNILY